MTATLAETAADQHAAQGEPRLDPARVARLQPVRGRLERAVITKSGAPVYVDYAHTPDALETALTALRPRINRRPVFCRRFPAPPCQAEGVPGDRRSAGGCRRARIDPPSPSLNCLDRCYSRTD